MVGDGNTLTISGALTVATNAGAVSLGNNLGGAGSLTMNGANTLTLSGTNSALSGPIILNNGTLNVDSVTALGTGTVTITNNAALNLNAGSSTTTALLVEGGKVSINASNNSVGILQVDAGIVDLNGNTLTTTNLTGGTNGSISSGGTILNNSATTNATLIVNASVAQEFNGTLANGTNGQTLSLVKNGASTLTATIPTPEEPLSMRVPCNSSIAGLWAATAP